MSSPSRPPDPPPQRHPAFHPPYHFRSEKLYVAYRVPRERLARALAAPYSPRSVLGLHLVVLEVAHFHEVRGSGSSPAIPRYDEIIHWTPATLGGRPTFCMWKLYLNDPLPIALGRDLYGFPKHPARISYRKEPGRLHVAVTPDSEGEAAAIELQASRRTLAHYLPVSDALVNRLAAEVAKPELMFVHPTADRLTVSRVFDVHAQGAELVSMQRARIPLFAALGLVEERRQRHPLLAVHLPSFRVSLGPAHEQAL